MTRVTQLIHNAGKYLLISVYPLPTHPTHNFTHTNVGNLETLPGWPKKLQHNRPARSAGQSPLKLAENGLISIVYKQRFLTPGHQGWNDLHRLCRIGMDYYLPNNDNRNDNNNNNNDNDNNDNNNDNNNNNNNNNNKTMMMMILIIIRMVTWMIIGTTTIMIMIIIITTTLTMTIMKMIMIKTAQTPC